MESVECSGEALQLTCLFAWLEFYLIRVLLAELDPGCLLTGNPPASRDYRQVPPESISFIFDGLPVSGNNRLVVERDQSTVALPQD